MTKLGFSEGPRTKSHLYTLRRQTPRSKAYVSIRYDYNNDFATVMAEFWGHSKTRSNGIGAEFLLIEITPRQNNLKRFPGIGGDKVVAHFVDVCKLMVRATKVFDALEEF